jgi:hypothetical protein
VAGKQADNRPGFVVIINPSNLFVSKDVPGNNIKFTLWSCFLSASSIGLKPNPDTHVLTNSGMAERTNILTLNDLSICIRGKGGNHMVICRQKLLPIT